MCWPMYSWNFTRYNIFKLCQLRPFKNPRWICWPLTQTSDQTPLFAVHTRDKSSRNPESTWETFRKNRAIPGENIHIPDSQGKLTPVLGRTYRSLGEMCAIIIDDKEQQKEKKQRQKRKRRQPLQILRVYTDLVLLHCWGCCWCLQGKTLLKLGCH